MLDELTEMNKHYRERFGYNFVVWAPTSSAEDILAMLRDRLPNNRMLEVSILQPRGSKGGEVTLVDIALVPGP